MSLPQPHSTWAGTTPFSHHAPFAFTQLTSSPPSPLRCMWHVLTSPGIPTGAWAKLPTLLLAKRAFVLAVSLVPTLILWGYGSTTGGSLGFAGSPREPGETRADAEFSKEAESVCSYWENLPLEAPFGASQMNVHTIPCQELWVLSALFT